MRLSRAPQGAWRSAKRGSTITISTRRAKRRRKASGAISRRRARPACRLKSTRAMPMSDTAAILEDEHAKGAFPAILHCFTGGADLAMRAVELGLYVSFSGVVTFKTRRSLRADRAERSARAHSGRDRCAVSGARSLIAARPTSRPTLSHTAAVVAADARHDTGGIRRRDDGEFLPALCNAKRPADASWSRDGKREGAMKQTLTILGCGSSGGVPRIGNDWGQCDPSESEEPAAAVLGAGRPLRQAGARPASSSIPDRMCASSCSTRASGKLDGVLYTHDHADHTHGIDDLRMVLRDETADRRLVRPPTRESLVSRFGYCFETPEARLPADPSHARH